MSTSPQIKKALAALLRDPGNATCADCKTQTHPRWASWSLGVFICIKCAGIHRSLGTHISKVKSVDLDTWKEENLIMLIKFKSNDIANKFYEAKLVDSKSQMNLNDTNRLQKFIKDKYEYKKWIGDSSKLESMSSNTQQQVHSPEQIQTGMPQFDRQKQTFGKQPSDLSNSRSNSLLDLQNLTTTSSNTGNNQVYSTINQSSNSNGNILKNSNANSSSSVSIQTQNVNRTAINNGTQRPDLKKSILSLYSKPSNSNSTMNGDSSNSRSSSSISLASASSFNGKNNSNTNMININNNINKINNYNSNNNVNNKNSSSTYNIEDDELMKNVWS